MSRSRSGLRAMLMQRVKVTVSAALLLGLIGLGASPAGGPSAALLDIALLGLGLWLSRTPTRSPASAGGAGGAMSGNQALLLLLAVGGAAVLIASGAASRPLHGLSVAPFAMAAFALSSRNARDLRSGVLAALASLLVLSAADDRAVNMTLCALGLVPLIFGWLAVRQLLLLDRRPDLVPRLSTDAARPWSAGLVLRLVVLTAVAALLIPTEPAPHLHGGEGSAPDQGQNPTTTPGERGSEIGNADGRLDLRERGDLDSTPMIDVPAGTPTLWQGGYVDDYSGSGWTRTTSFSPPAVDDGTLPLPAPMPTGPGLTESVVDRLAPGQELVYAPGPLISVDAKAGRFYDQGTGSIAVHDSNDPLGAYTVDWRAPGSTSVGILTRTRPPVADRRWLQLPVVLPTRVRSLARTVTTGAATTADKVSAIEDYLRSHEKYELDSPVPAQGADAVDAFLFVDHVGFCEQFASAEAVMLRTLGIPARVATGYGGDGVLSADGSRRIYRNQDAHAWVQVGYPGERWVDSDPTRGSELAPVSVQHRFENWLKRLWQRLTGTPGERRVLAASLIILFLAVWGGLLLVRRWRRARSPRRDDRAAAAEALESAAGQAYQRLLARLADQGRPRRETETVRDLLLRLRSPDRELVLSVLESEWYGRPSPAQPELVELVVVLLDGLAQDPVPVGAASP